MYRERCESKTISLPVDVYEYRLLCQFCTELISKSLEKDTWIDYKMIIKALKEHDPDSDPLPFVTVGGER